MKHKNITPVYIHNYQVIVLILLDYVAGNLTLPKIEFFLNFLNTMPNDILMKLTLAGCLTRHNIFNNIYSIRFIVVRDGKIKC